jgi:galactose-1-phosphate uridylyltransferase
LVIEFKKEDFQSRFLDPEDDYRERSQPIELRTDPLTGRTSFVYQVNRVSVPQKDLTPLVAKSIEMQCPFCAGRIETKTPKFVKELVPEGRLKVGDAVIFPNLRSYAPYSAVLVISQEHFVALRDFNRRMLVDALVGSQQYLKRVRDYDPKAEYFYIGWNYMPPAGGSVLHPHMQPEAGYQPPPYQQELLDASAKYHRDNGRSYWDDFIETEEKLGERYLGATGGVNWLVPFAPRSRVLDVTALFGKHSLFAISEKEFGDFTAGLQAVFQYMTDKNYYSFNMLLVSGREEDRHFRVQARLVARMTFLDIEASDCCYQEMLGDIRFSARYPEEVAREMKPYFKTRGGDHAAGH